MLGISVAQLKVDTRQYCQNAKEKTWVSVDILPIGQLPLGWSKVSLDWDWLLRFS